MLPLQLGGQPFGDNSVLSLLIFYLPFLFLIFYGQRLQATIALHRVSASLRRLQGMRDRARRETVDYAVKVCKPSGDPTERIDQFLEYFVIFPVDMDPSGIVPKIEHVLTIRDDRIKAEVRNLFPETDSRSRNGLESLVEIATSMNQLFKLVRHFYLMGKQTKSFFIIVQLEMIMPMIFEYAHALMHAVDAFKGGQPVGDGIGAVVAGRLMLEAPKQAVAKETVMAEREVEGRRAYLIKAEGPLGSVGEPGKGVEHVISDLAVRPDAIIMIDAALKLEGEKSGSIAEGIGAAIGGIGTDRFRIEEVASKHSIPLYAVVVKQSITEAISAMTKEIAEAADRVIETIKRVIREKTPEAGRVIIVGVGNTVGIGQ